MILYHRLFVSHNVLYCMIQYNSDKSMTYLYGVDFSNVSYICCMGAMRRLVSTFLFAIYINLEDFVFKYNIHV